MSPKALRAIARTITVAFMLLTATVSYLHIVHSIEMLGLTTWERWTAPFLVDGFAILGLIGRTKGMPDGARRGGTWIALTAGTLSLAANIHAGASIGGRLYGALVVIIFMASEWYSSKLAAKLPEVEQAEAEAVEAEAKTVRSERAKKAAATRKRNAEAAAQAEALAMRKARRELSPVQ